MKKLQDYSNEISKANPGELCDLLIELTSDYAEVCELLNPVAVAKMKFYIENKRLESEKPVSDKMLEMMWMSQPDEKLNGILEKRMEMYKKALSTLMSNVKTIIRQKENESRNQY